MVENGQNLKWIAEVRQGGEWTKDGVMEGGEWVALKDSLGVEQIFDCYREAYNYLRLTVPAMQYAGKNIGRVREVEMIMRKK